jgi:hypothetical protein
MLYEVIGGVTLLLAILALFYTFEKQGRNNEQNDEMQQVLDDIHTANMARDALESDPDFARRVRDRFTR